VASVLTLLELRTRTRERADQVNSTFISDTELNGYVNQSAYELYDLLVSKYGDNYWASSSTITTDGTNDTYVLPADFYKLLGVDLQTNGATSGWLTLKSFTMAERNRNWRPNVGPVLGIAGLRYRLLGDRLWLTPMPISGQVLRIWYVPRMNELTLDASTLDGISGWHEYVIVDAAIKCLIKEESDPSALMAVKAGLIKRIEDAASNRDEGAPPVVSDVTSMDSFNGLGYPGYGGFGY
jgi:hypothetical protein